MNLVYDMVYPIVDKANVAYIGITGALAYRLPSEPINLEEAFNQALQDGNLPLLDRTEEVQPIGVVAADPRNGTNFERRPVDSYYNQQQQTQQGNPYRPDRYYTNSQQPQQPQQQPQQMAPSAIAKPVRTDTYLLGGPDAPKDRYYAGQPGGPPPNRYYANGGRNPGPPEPGVIDQFSNKMDYYFSYADNMLRAIKDLTEHKVNPFKNVQWKVGEPSNRNNYNGRLVNRSLF